MNLNQFSENELFALQSALQLLPMKDQRKIEDAFDLSASSLYNKIQSYLEFNHSNSEVN